MIPLPLLLEHLYAVIVTMAAAAIAGLPVANMLRIRLGLPGALLLGVAYWAVALYLFPFSGGLHVAMITATSLRLVTILSMQARGRQSERAARHTWILVVGCASYATFLCTSYVPMGMDASMHTTSARLIAEQAGLPESYAPFAPQLVFPAVNLGLPTLAAVAIRLGSTPASAMLAAEHLTFTCFILATYLVLRPWMRGSSAACLAVLAAWSSRGMQETLGWGGFPTVMSLALGLLAARLLIDIQRRPSFNAVVPLGTIIAALPLVHGVSAAIWVYTIAPVAFVVGLAKSRQRSRGIAALGIAGCITLICLLAYRSAGYTALQESEIAWTRDWQAGYAPEGEGFRLLLNSLNYIKTYAGSLLIWAGVIATGVLLARRRFTAAIGLTGIALLLALVVANSRHWLLPFSMLLYPERAVYWGTPLAAVAIAMMLRAIPIQQRSLVTMLLVGGLLIPSLLRHYQSFQRVAFRPEVTREGWETLEWAREYLDQQNDYVAAPYNSAGSYLPAVAGVATTGWHAHHFLHEEAKAMARTRTLTHIFVPRGVPLPAGQVLFHNDNAAIIRLPSIVHVGRVRQ